MKLDYIYHSGFAIEADGATILIDYWKDSSAEAGQGLVRDRLLHRPGAFYVLATHFHPDHFHPEVLRWRDVRPDIRYIFSKDILKHRRAKADDAFYINKGGVYEDDHLRIQAFGSTDVGVSFLLDLQGLRLFHAGDLNNWHWMDESPEEEWKRDEAFFLRELEDIAVCKEKIDVVLFPVDPRLGKEYMRGPLQFVKRIKTTIFVPMHFDEAFEKASAFAPLAASEGTQVLTPLRRGETLNLDHYINLK